MWGNVYYSQYVEWHTLKTFFFPPLVEVLKNIITGKYSRNKYLFYEQKVGIYDVHIERAGHNEKV